MSSCQKNVFMSGMQISYKRVKTCYKIKINYRESKSCIYGVLMCKQHPSLTIVTFIMQ